MTCSEAKREIESFLDKAIRLRDDAYTLREDTFEQWRGISVDDYEFYVKLTHAINALEDVALDIEDIIEDMAD